MKKTERPWYEIPWYRDRFLRDLVILGAGGAAFMLALGWLCGVI